MCGKEFVKYPSQIKKQYCSRKCRNSDSVIHEARANAMWKGTWKQQRRISRQNYLASGKKIICEKCNALKNVHIHHKDKNRNNNELSNLEALCNSCHNKFYKHTIQRCINCKQILSLTKSHTCPTFEQRQERGIKSIKFRERCKECGKMMGKDKHVCGEHPKGFNGHKHTIKTRELIGKKLSIIKTDWWKTKEEKE